MQYRCWISVLAVLLVACGSPAAATPTVVPPTMAVAPTSTPAPTVTPAAAPTSTAVPLAQRDLEPILIQPGDLPASLTPGQFIEGTPKFIEDVPTVDKVAGQNLNRDGEAKGFVIVLLYGDNNARAEAFHVATKAMGPGAQSFKELGDQAMVTPDGTIFHSIDLVFLHCLALVYIRVALTNDFSAKTDLGGIITYAQRLDHRLMPLVC